jgi:hypothetical protein
VPLVLGVVHELILHDADQQRKVRGLCTTAFALGQASAAYGYFYIFTDTGGAYRVLFALRVAALAAALVIDVDRPTAYQAPSSRVRMTVGPSILRGLV